MDLRLSEALGQTPGLWLKMQATYDLWHASRQRRKPVPPLRKAA
jgi:plasmid maintenance system antidote protein VapI